MRPRHATLKVIKIVNRLCRRSLTYMIDASCLIDYK